MVGLFYLYDSHNHSPVFCSCIHRTVHCIRQPYFLSKHLIYQAFGHGQLAEAMNDEIFFFNS